eukprot:6367188-Karenia_brevis.AAC.1
MYRDILSGENLVHFGMLTMYGHMCVLRPQEIQWELNLSPPDLCAHPYFVSVQIPKLALNDNFDGVCVYEGDGNDGLTQVQFELVNRKAKGEREWMVGSLSTWMLSSPLHRVENRIHRSISGPDVLRLGKYVEVDVPGDGRCFMYSLMVWDALNDTNLEIWKDTERNQGGIPKNTKRYQEEKEMLEA